MTTQPSDIGQFKRNGSNEKRSKKVGKGSSSKRGKSGGRRR